MTYSIVWTKPATKDRKKLDATMRKRVDAAVESLADDPRPEGAQKVVTSPGTWRIRVGTYRVLYTIDDEDEVVTITAVRPRGGAY